MAYGIWWYMYQVSDFRLQKYWISVSDKNFILIHTIPQTYIQANMCFDWCATFIVLSKFELLQHIFLSSNTILMGICQTLLLLQFHSDIYSALIENKTTYISMWSDLAASLIGSTTSSL